VSAVERSAAFEWGFEKGEQAERERIIKLLKTVRGMMTYSDELLVAVQLIESGSVDVYGYNWINGQLKGENK
jgi:hypothetical protein